jgi:hypothetical protein
MAALKRIRAQTDGLETPARLSPSKGQAALSIVDQGYFRPLISRAASTGPREEGTDQKQALINSTRGHMTDREIDSNTRR